MPKPLLSVIIPTYNRKDFLRTSLTNVIRNVRRIPDIAEIVVCDNASTDGTEQVVKELLLGNEDIITYFRHSENYGYFYNFNYGIEHSKGEYVFLHGDDDIMPEYFLFCILNLIKDNPEISLFHFNYLMSGPKMNSFNMAYSGSFDGSILRFYDKGLDFIKEHHNIPSFMSSNVFKREVWLSGKENAKDYSRCWGYEWLYLVYNGILNKKCAYYCLPLFIQRFSGVESYSPKMPLYTLAGLYNMFKLLDESNDLYIDWKNYHQKSQKCDYIRCILDICTAKPLYKEHYADVIEHVANNHKWILNFSLNYLTPGKIYRILKLGLYYKKKFSRNH